MVPTKLGKLFWIIATAIACGMSPLRATVLVSQFTGGGVVDYSSAGSLLSTLVSSGSGGLSLPHRSRIALDGTLLVASAGTDRILQYHATSGAYLGEFIGVGGGLDYPVDMVFRPDGYVYVSSQLTDEVLRFSASTGVRDAGWSASSGLLDGPSGIAFDASGNLYVSGRFSNNVLRFSSNGTFSANLGTVSSAFGMTFHPDGSLLVSSGAGSVQRFTTPSGTPSQSTWASGLNVPVGIESAGDGTFLVAQFGANTITRFSSNGTSLGTFASGSPLNGPNFITVVPEPSTLFGVLVAGLLFLVIRSTRESRKGAKTTG